MPPHHPLLGHLGVVNGVLSKLPWDAHGQYGASLLQRADPSLGSIIYLDTWPFSPPILWVMSPEALHQVTTTHSLPKHAGMKRVLTPLAGEDNMLTLEGSAWKAWRTVFNPGFSPNHLMTQVPEIVEETEVFRDILAENADRGEILRMETLTIRLTLDIIGRITT